MNDTQANLLRERILKECRLKKANPTIKEIHSTLSKPYNMEFKGSGLFFEDGLVDNPSLRCIESIKNEYGYEMKNVKNGYVIYEPAK